MDFSLNEEQRLLEESVERYVEKEYPFEARNALLATDLGFSRDNWRRFAELGWLGVSVPEEYGGFGGGAVENMVISEGFGRAMVLEPFLTTAVLGARALALSANEELRAEVLPAVAAGELLLAVAFCEATSRYDLHHVETTATAAGNTFRVNGEKIVVLDAPSADRLVVSARLGGETRDRTGIGLFLVDRNADGVTLTGYPTMDGARGANVRFADAPAAMLVDQDDGLAVLERVVEWGTAALCAQAVGAMGSAYRQTVDYTKTREQFGAPIGSFQVIKHRLVDLFIAVRESESMMHMVAAAVMDDDPDVRRRSVSAAKCFIGQRARTVAQDAVQIHGGIGFTEELAVGHFFRYLTLFCLTFGSTDYHLRRYADLTQA